MQMFYILLSLFFHQVSLTPRGFYFSGSTTQKYFKETWRDNELESTTSQNKFWASTSFNRIFTGNKKDDIDESFEKPRNPLKQYYEVKKIDDNCTYKETGNHLDSKESGEKTIKQEDSWNFVGTEPPHSSPNPFISGWDNFSDRQGENKQKKGGAKKWCSEYEIDCKNNIKLTSRIVGGSPAKGITFMALIGYDGPKIEWLCGGSLISKRFVLSAAHCAKNGQGSPAKIARLGELDISRNDDSRLQDKKIIERILHPGFKQPPLYNDIALFKLDSDVIFNEFVSPLCLQTENQVTSERGTVSGWGRIDFALETSDRLLKVDVSIFTTSECQTLNIGNGTANLPRGLDPTTMICAGERAGGKDSCTGDSGGPLFVDVGKCLKQQIGITSAGQNCGLPNTPGIYTNVSYYLDWIEPIVWE